MDIQARNPTIIQPAETSLFNTQNYLIFALLVLLIFSVAGINLFLVSGKVFDQVKSVFMPLIEKVLGMLGYSSGILINKTADVGSDVVKVSADVAEGALQSAGNLLITASKPLIQGGDMSSLDNVLQQQKPHSQFNPQPDESGSQTQAAISSHKRKWCLVEEIDNRRKCLGVEESQKCMSGQVFETHSQCLHPPQSPSNE